MKEASSNAVVRRSWERPRLVSLARTPETGAGSFSSYGESVTFPNPTCSICGSYRYGSATS